MLNIQNTALIMSAGNPSQFPVGSIPEIALSGRSNVGKSSLVNTVLGRKNFARVSSAPGKTITINFYLIDKKLYIADLPGYGYAKVSDEEHVPELVVQLIDLKAGATDDDRMMFDFLNRSGIPYIIAATKCDKLNKTNREKNLAALSEDELLNSPAASEKIKIIPFSSLTGEGRAELLSVFSAVSENKRANG